MSEPVSDVEIEDVLSSIRRLVSAGEEGKVPDKVAQDAVSDTPPRFVLTPAFRVTEADEHVESFDADDVVSEDTQADLGETTVVFADEAEEEPTASFAHEPASRDSLEATIAELEAAVIDQPDEWEPDGSEVTTVPTWETVSYPPLDEVEDAVAVEETSPEDTGHVPANDPFVLEDVDTPDDAWVMTDALATPEADDLEEEPDAVDPILTSGPFIAEDAVYTADDPMPAPEGADRFADIQNVESLTFSHSQPIQMPDDPTDDYGDELLPDPDPVGEDDDIDAYMFSNAKGINEEVLREMVMDVVRQELQGNLGERITRNVRKMVRREIHRALDMQNFD